MKINSIYDMIGNVDDKFVSEAAAVRRKRPVLLIAAAIAAALALFVGFSSDKNDYKSKLTVGNEAVIPFDLCVWEIDIPEKYYPEDGHLSYFDNAVQMSISELAAEFGLDLLGVNNENFSEEIDLVNHVWNTDGDLLWIYYGEPQLYVSDDRVEFYYYLQSNSCGKKISINAMFSTNKECGIRNKFDVYDGMQYKIVRLNDGSQCYVDWRGAMFSYNGVYYQIYNFDGVESIEYTMQILKDLGVL